MQDVSQTQTQTQSGDYDATSIGRQIVCSDGGLGGEWLGPDAFEYLHGVGGAGVHLKLKNNCSCKRTMEGKAPLIKHEARTS